MYRSTELYESRKCFIAISRTSFLINALYDAVVDGDLGTVNFLLTTKNVDPNILLEEYDAAPLHTATGIGTEELAVKLVQLLLEHYANPNIKTSDGTTPLMVSSLWGRPIVTTILLKYGADPWMEDSEGKNALDYASENGYFEMHEILKNTHINVTITSDETVTDDHFSNKSFYVFSRSLIDVAPNSKKYAIGPNHDASTYFNISCEIGKNAIDYVYEKDCYKVLEPLNNAHINVIISSDESVTDLHSSNKSFYVFSRSLIGGAPNCDKNANDSIYEASPYININCDIDKSAAISDISQNDCYGLIDPLNAHINVTISSDKTVCDQNSSNKSFYAFSRPLIGEAPNCDKNANDATHEASPYISINCDIDNSAISDISQNDCYGLIDPLNAHINVTISSDKNVSDQNSSNRSIGISPKFVVETHNSLKFHDIIDDALRIYSHNENNLSESGSLDTAFIGISNLQDSVSSTGTFWSVTHKDVTSVPLIERNSNKARSHPDEMSQTCDNRSSSLSELNSESHCSVISYGTDRIREELKKNHIIHGPVTKTTKKVYQNLIKKVIKGSKKNFIQNNKFSNYPEMLQNTFKESYKDSINKWSNLEELMSKNFANDKRVWRGGKEKQFFTYILLDPFITNDLPRRRFEMSEFEIWKTFILSIFYVGKGKNSRPFSHLFEALKCNIKKTVSKKVLRIQKIWASSAGIICLHLFHNIISAEAHSREAAMIDAIGLRNLTNIQSGEYYGIVKNWSIKQKQQLGIVLLNKALQIYLAEGERQIFPTDLT